MATGANIFQHLDNVILISVDTAVTSILGNIWLFGVEAIAPILTFWTLMLGVGMWTGHVEMTVRQFWGHIFSLFAIFALGFNAFGYTQWVEGFLDAIPNGIITMVSPSYTGFSAQLDNQMNNILGLVNKLQEGDGYFWPYLLSGGVVVFGLVYSVVIFGIYVMSSLASGILLSLGPFMFLALISKKTNGLFEGWFKQLLNYKVLLILLVLSMNLVNALIDEAMYRINPTEDVYTLGDVWPVFVVMGISLFAIKELRQIAASITGTMTLLNSHGLERATNSVQNGLNTGFRGFQGAISGSARRPTRTPANSVSGR